MLYDGVCGLCNRTVRFMLARDRAGLMGFAPLAGDTAAGALGQDPPEADTIVYLRHYGTAREKRCKRSTAVLLMLRDLGGAWRIISWMLWAVPRPLRNAVYNFIARRRYRWYGKLDACPVPPPEYRAQFLP